MTEAERRTEAGGWLAVWRLVQCSARIMEISHVSAPTEPPRHRSESFSAAPDLADARERFPNLSPLWDAIRAEYWSELSAPHDYSRGRAAN